MPHIIPLDSLAPGNSQIDLMLHWSERPLLLLDPADQRIVQASAAVAETLKLKPADLSGRAFQSFLPREQGRELLHTHIQSLLDQLASEPDALISAAPFELRVQRADDFIIVAQVRLAALRLSSGAPKLLLEFTDRTDATVAEQQAWAEAQAYNFSNLLESIGDGFLALDHRGEIILANSSASRISGRLAHELVGHRLSEIFPEFDDRQLEQIQPGQPQNESRRTLITVLDGVKPRQFEIILHAHPQGYGALLRDVTDWMHHEREIAKLNATMAVSQELLRHKNDELNESLEQLATLNDQLKKADQLKGEFLANTSHELRTPLNSIIGFLQLIDEGLFESEEERGGYISNALASAKHLLALINDLLDITKIEAGKMNFLVENHEVDELFQEIYSITYVQAQQKSLKLNFNMRGESSLYFRADLHKTAQVLINLVGNAVKFTDKGSVDVTASLDPENADLVRFEVKDTGIGIPPHKQHQIFDKFMQIDGTSKRKYQGTGLGLAITKNLVEMMGGSVGVSSPGLEQGTTMWFTLPRGINPSQAGGANWNLEEGEDQLPDTF